MRLRKFFRIFRSIIVYLVVLSFVRISFADTSVHRLSDAEDKIVQAKVLYYDLQFDDSKKLLEEVISSLNFLPKTNIVNRNLSEAYLTLALNQFAQSESKDMKDSLFQSVNYEPNRELDPVKYPPSFIDLFNDAKQRHLIAKTVRISKLSGKDEKNEKIKKPFYKTWPFYVIIGVVVAGGAAGTALALGGGGGGNLPVGPVTAGGTPQ